MKPNDIHDEMAFGDVELVGARRQKFGMKSRIQIMPSPWRTIWLHPRVTMARIIAINPGHDLIKLVILAGLTNALLRASGNQLGDSYPLMHILIGCAILGPLIGCITVYLGGFCLQRGAGLFGSPAPVSHFQSAIAWGSAPMGLVLILFLATVCLLRQEAFAPSIATVLANPALGPVMIAERILRIAFLVWCVVLTLLCLREVSQLNWFKLAAGMVVGIFLFAVFLLMGGIVLVMLLNLMNIETIWLRPAPPTIIATQQPARPTVAPLRLPPATTPVGRGRISPNASSDFRDKLGPEIVALLDLGLELRINGSVVSAKPPITRLEITLAGDPPAGTNRLESLKGLKEITSLRIIPDSGSSGSKRLSRAEMASICALPKLQRLYLGRCGFDVDAPRELRMAKTLEELDLQECPQLDLKEIHLIGRLPNLKKLRLDGTQISSLLFSTTALGRWPALQYLYVENCDWTDVDMINIAGLTGLKELWIGGNRRFNGKGLDELRLLTSLQFINLSGTSCNDDVVARIVALKSLQNVNVTGTVISVQGFDLLLNRMPGLTVVRDGKAYKSPPAKKR